ncbi:right-handed parallel beta-helix repeat-containing protein [Paenibacillus ferrarius]|nr:right-handed parallel beta-helix repeat-containing protein [Paenibacillus ferrarius]
MMPFYISPAGDDANPGTEQLPFATFQQAQRAARNYRVTNGMKDQVVQVVVRGGTYYLHETLTLTEEDSFTSFSTYSEEHAIVSGGRKLNVAWRPYRDGIFVAEVPEILKEQLQFTQLFVNGKRQIRARYPKYDPSIPGVSGYTYPADCKLQWPHREMKFDPQKFTDKRWSKPEEAELHIFGKNYWGNLQWKIKAIEWENHTIAFGKGGFQINDVMQGEDATGIDQHSRFFIENVFEELDSPGEWYADFQNGLLYYYPLPELNLEDAIFEVPQLQRLIEIRGTQETPVVNIGFNGFHFTHTTTTYLEKYEAPSLGDWSIHRGGAVYMEGAEKCSIEFCRFDAVGGNAIFISDFNRDHRIYGCLITDAGESAICLVGSKHLTMGSQHAYPANVLVANNEINNIGYYGKQTAGVFISVGRNHTIAHNHIHHIPRAAICINDGTWGGHVIEYNDIHNTVQETGDHGPFNSWGRDRFWCLEQSHGPASHCAGDVKKDAREVVTIRNNRFVDNSGWGIDLDDGSSHYHIHHNVCIGISIKLREGDYRLVENNIFYHPANPPGIHIGYEHNHDRFLRNIIVAHSNADNPEVDINFEKGESRGKLYEFIGPPLESRWVEELDYNIFFNDLGYFKATVHFRPLGSRTEHYSIDEWKSLGWDRHSVFADPLFTDPEQGDFSLKEGSPALKLGFSEIDLSKVGLLPDFQAHYLSK